MSAPLFSPPKEKSEQVRARILAQLDLDHSAKSALDDRAWDAWSKAWDAARAKDESEGRRYDRSRYSEAATAARIAVFEAALVRGGK